MIREQISKTVFREDLFFDSQGQGHANEKAREITEGRYEIKGPLQIHRWDDWLTAWQENNES